MSATRRSLPATVPPSCPLLCALALFALCETSANAQYEMQQVALIDQTPVIIEVPFPFVDASHVLPEAFAKRRQNAAAGAVPSRLIGWFIPTSSLKDELNEKNTRYRFLQVQEQRDMEPVRYDSAHLKAMLNDFVLKAPDVPAIDETSAAALFQILNLSQFTERPARKFLGHADLGADSFTLCIATSIEGKDLSGGRPIETSIVCVTNILLKGKILQLTVTGPELTPAELRNTMRLTKEWIELLRAANSPDAAPPVRPAQTTPPPPARPSPVTPPDEWREWRQLEAASQKTAPKK